MTGDLRLSFW